jgi:hypothetical protein
MQFRLCAQNSVKFSPALYIRVQYSVECIVEGFLLHKLILPLIDYKRSFASSMRIVRGVGSAVCAAAAQASFLSSSSVVVRLQHAAWLFRSHHRSLSATSRITTTTLSSASQNNNNKDRSFSHPMIAATGSFREKLVSNGHERPFEYCRHTMKI